MKGGKLWGEESVEFKFSSHIFPYFHHRCELKRRWSDIPRRVTRAAVKQLIPFRGWVLVNAVCAEWKRERERRGRRDGIRGTDWYLGNRSCRESPPNAEENHGTNEIQPRIGPPVSSIPMIFRPSLRVWLKIRQAIAISTREHFWLECEELGIVIWIASTGIIEGRYRNWIRFLSSLTYYVFFKLIFPLFSISMINIHVNLEKGNYFFFFRK